MKSVRLTMTKAEYDRLTARDSALLVVTTPLPLKQVKLDYVKSVLAHCNGNKSQARKLLGVTRQTMIKYAALFMAVLLLGCYDDTRSERQKRTTTMLEDRRKQMDEEGESIWVTGSGTIDAVTTTNMAQIISGKDYDKEIEMWRKWFLALPSGFTNEADWGAEPLHLFLYTYLGTNVAAIRFGLRDDGTVVWRKTP